MKFVEEVIGDKFIEENDVCTIFLKFFELLVDVSSESFNGEAGYAYFERIEIGFWKDFEGLYDRGIVFSLFLYESWYDDFEGAGFFLFNTKFSIGVIIGCWESKYWFLIGSLGFDIVFEWSINNIEGIIFFKDEGFDKYRSGIGFNGHDEVEWFEDDFLFQPGIDVMNG